MPKKQTRCCERTRAGKPCGAHPRPDPDPDGKRRCVPHSKHPDAVATRKKQAAGGTAAAKKLAAQRREERGLPPIGAPPARKPGALDLSSPEGVRAALEDTWARMLDGSVNPEVAKAAASLGRTALALVTAAAGGKGGGKGTKTVIPTVVRSMDDVEALKRVNAAAQHEADAELVH